MANTKGKIVMVVGATTVFSIVGGIVYSLVRKKKIKEKIYNSLNDTKSVAGYQAPLDDTDRHKALVGFDPIFWKNGKNGVMPDVSLLFRDMDARAKARKIWDAIHDNDWFGATEDEDTVMQQIKNLKSQGQLSQVTDQYANGLLGSGRDNGDLSEDIGNALEGGYFTKDYLDELNKEVENKPF